MGRIVGARVRIVLAAAITALLATAATASAHTWNLENDFAASPDGVTAPANPFPDSYGNEAVWAVGYGGGGSYSSGAEGPVYSGLTTFTVAPAGDWHGYNAFYFAGATEGWKDSSGYAGEFPYIGDNTGAEAAGWWPGETVFAHPAPDLEAEQPRDTVRWTSPITGTVAIDGTFASVDCGAAGNGIDYSVDRQPAGSGSISHLSAGHVQACGSEGSSATYSSAGVAVQQGDTYYFSVGDGGEDNYAFDSTAITLTITDGAAETLSVSAPAAATATYKHAIKAITVKGLDSDGDAVTLSASDVPAGLSFSASTGVLSGAPTVTPGNYVITFTADDGHGEKLTKRLRLTVEKASCAIANKPALFASKTPATLKVKVSDPVTKAKIAGLSIGFPVAALQTGNGVGTWSGVSGSTGVASAKASLAPGEVYLAGAYTEGNADYLPCQTTSSEIVTVAPSTYVSAGAGTLTVAKAVTSFGYIAVNEAPGGNPIILRTPGGELLGGTITSISKSGTTVTWTGEGGWNNENAQYTATASDPSTGADTLSITVTVGGETRWSSGGPIAVKGGDLKVH